MNRILKLSLGTLIFILLVSPYAHATFGKECKMYFSKGQWDTVGLSNNNSTSVIGSILYNHKIFTSIDKDNSAVFTLNKPDQLISNNTIGFAEGWDEVVDDAFDDIEKNLKSNNSNLFYFTTLATISLVRRIPDIPPEDLSTL